MGKFNVQRFKQTVTILDESASGEITNQNLNGFLRGVGLDVPQLDGTTTVTIDILDADGITVYTKASIAENAKTFIGLDAQNNPLNVPLSGLHTIRITASSTQTSGDKAIPVVLLIER